MKRHLFLLFLILCSLSLGYAQNNPYRINDDMYAYYQQCRENLTKKVCLAMCDTLFQMAGRIGDVKAQCLAATLRVDHYFYIKADIKKIKQEQQRATDFIIHTPYSQYIFSGWNRIISYYIDKNDFYNALDEIKQYQDMAYKLNSTYGINRSFVRLGDVFLHNKLNTIALTNYQKAVDYSKMVGETQDIAYVYYAMAECYIQQNQYDKAHEMCQLSIKNARTEGQLVGAYRILRSVASLQKNAALSLAYADTIENIYKSKRVTYTQRDLDELYRGNASVLLQQNRVDEAQKYASLIKTPSERDKFLMILYEYNKDYKNLYYLKKKLEERQDSINQKFSQVQLESFMENFNRRILQEERDKFAMQEQELRHQQNLIQSRKDSMQREQDTLVLQQQNLEYARINTQIRLIQEQASQRQRQESVNQERLYLRQRTLTYGFVILAVLIFACGVLVFFIIRKSTRLKKEKKAALQALADAEEADRQKTNFLHNMNHEIRTPLNVIVGFTDILSAEDQFMVTPEEKQNMLADIEEKSVYLQGLVNDILDLSKLESGTYIFQKNEFGLESLCKEEMARIAPQLASAVQLKLDLKQNSIITADRLRLGQLVHELLRNALQHTTAGWIELSCEMVGKQLTIIVSDTGCGIPEGKENEIFNRFYKLNQFAPGFGLGLCICRTIAQLLHGDVVLDTTYKQGARFVAKVSCE